MIDCAVRNEKLKKVMTIFIILNVLNYTVFQVLSILRASTIYNVTVLSIVFLLLTSLYLSMQFIKHIRLVRFNFIEVCLMLIPLIFLFLGIYINGINRDIFSDTYTSVFFIILFVFARMSDYEFESRFQITIANWMFLGLLISMIIYKVAPMLGLSVYSIGVTSIYFVFPLMVFLSNKMYLRGFTHLVLLVFASKRGILLSILVTFFIMGLENKNIKRQIRLTVILVTIAFLYFVIIISLTPKNVASTPAQFQRLIYKIMLVNPFSEYNKIWDDFRVLEVKSAIRPIIEDPIFLLTGKGAGYSYSVFDNNGVLLQNDIHNSHFSPAGIYVKYGAVYLIIFYYYIIRIIRKSYKLLKKKILSRENLVLLLYVTAGFINSFTAFTFYNDYLFILSLAVLQNTIKKCSIKTIMANNVKL